MIGTEAVDISTLGALTGLAVGAGIGTAVARALRHRRIPDLSHPWTELAAYLALAVVVGVLAAVLPAIRTARTNVLSPVGTNSQPPSLTPAATRAHEQADGLPAAVLDLTHRVTVGGRQPAHTRRGFCQCSGVDVRPALLV